MIIYHNYTIQQRLELLNLIFFLESYKESIMNIWKVLHQQNIDILHSHFYWFNCSNEILNANTEFNFDTKFYNLIQVSQSEYEHCTALEPLKVFNSSPVNFPLKERGVYYFICSVSNYCTLGQKIKIYVHQSAPKISPTPSASPPQQKAPMISPQISPNGSVPQPSGSINPPPPSNVPSPTPGCPSSFQGKKFDIDVKLVCAMLGTFIGFWVM